MRNNDGVKAYFRARSPIVINPLHQLKSVLLVSLLFVCPALYAQDLKGSYTDSMLAYVQHYVKTHEVVKGADRKHLHFFAPDSSYRVTASFEKIDDPIGFGMPGSMNASQQFYRYGKIRFVINDTACELTVYRSKRLMQTEEYKNALFIPFTDVNTGAASYEGGRYIDIAIPDIKDGKIVIDFNKAYNPYCCYTIGYNCPIPPKENTLPVAINAGEMKYTKAVH